MSNDFNIYQPWNFLNNYLNPSNPADSAMQYYNKIPGFLQNAYAPYMQNEQTASNGMNEYMQNGLSMGTPLKQQFNNLVNNPAGVMNHIGASFQQSPGYQFQVNQSLNAANRAAAAGGMAGTPAEQQQVASVTNGLANQDYYNYMNHAMGLYGQGLSGMQNMYNTGAQMGENMYDTDANMANQYAQNMAAAYMNQGNLSYTGDINQQQMQGQRIGGLIGMFGGMMGGGI